MTRPFAEYSIAYKNVAMERRDNILLVRLHTDGGPFVWEESAHRELPEVFAEIGIDQENHVVILTGTGDSFLDSVDGPSWTPELRRPLGRDVMFREAKQLLRTLLDITVPVLGVVNGPARIHAEVPLLSDVVIASDTAAFTDGVHFTTGGVPGDGVHTLWQRWLGPNRGRAFLMQCQEIGAQEALQLGLVSEVLPPNQLMDRAWEIAYEWVKRPVFTLRYTRAALTLGLKRAINDELDEGLALEMLGRAFMELEYPDVHYPYVKERGLFAGQPDLKAGPPPGAR